MKNSVQCSGNGTELNEDDKITGKPLHILNRIKKERTAREKTRCTWQLFVLSQEKRDLKNPNHWAESAFATSTDFLLALNARSWIQNRGVLFG